MIEQWRIFLMKEKVLYESLNKMEMSSNFLVARLYIPTDDISMLGDITKMSPAPVFTELRSGKPPSKFETNSFTFVGQEIVETYGVPRYG
jgi:V-type H+-transporting ATPase subunit a